LKAKTLILVAVLPAALTLTGCAKIKSLVGGKPKGQVVATVNGDEITSTELSTELAGFNSKDPAIVKLAQQRALQQIIMRDLMAQKAREAKLDKSPEYTVQVKRGEEALLVQLYQKKLVGSVAVPSRQEAEAFILSHPTMFADRKILVLDQLVAPGGKLKKEQLEPLKTLEQVKALFNTENIPYQENVAAVDTANTDPRMVAQIEKLPPGEVFVVPQGQALVFNRVSSERVVPITGDVAVKIAQGSLRNQRAQEAVRNQMIAMREGAEDKIVYNPAFKPAKSFKDSLPPTPAPGAAPAAAPATGASANAATPAAAPTAK
jgi:peptidyl-prolyl cis-trans isomerase C